MHTTDGGANWQAQRSGTVWDLESVSAADADTAWVVGFDGTILHTDDGGATWSAQAVPISGR